MKLEQFIQSLQEEHPRREWNACLKALWHDAKGSWDKAHSLIQDLPTPDAAWIHAYLHRKEGDHGNAGYWYHKAGKPYCDATLQAEWEDMARSFLD